MATKKKWSGKGIRAYRVEIRWVERYDQKQLLDVDGFEWCLVSSNGTEVAKSVKLWRRADRAERSWNTFADLAPNAPIMRVGIQ